VAHRRIGQVLIREGLVTAAQLREMLELQATQDRLWQRGATSPPSAAMSLTATCLARVGRLHP